MRQPVSQNTQVSADETPFEIVSSSFVVLESEQDSIASNCALPLGCSHCNTFHKTHWCRRQSLGLTAHSCFAGSTASKQHPPYVPATSSQLPPHPTIVQPTSTTSKQHPVNNYSIQATCTTSTLVCPTMPRSSKIYLLPAKYTYTHSRCSPPGEGLAPLRYTFITLALHTLPLRSRLLQCTPHSRHSHSNPFQCSSQ